MCNFKGGEPIIADGGDGHKWRLIFTNSGHVVRCGDTVRNFRGGTAIVVGGRPPMAWGSTGHVWTADNQQFYPGVFNLAWLREDQP